jgi:hypothetical protein
MLRQNGAQDFVSVGLGWPWDAMESAAGSIHQIPE